MLPETLLSGNEDTHARYYITFMASSPRDPTLKIHSEI